MSRCCGLATGSDRVIPATIAVEAERLAPGRFVQRSPVQLNLSSSAEPSLGGVIARLRDIAFTCEFIENEKTLLWRKLTFLAPFAMVTSASGKNKGEVFADSGWKDKLEAAVAEACAVAKADGAEVDTARLQAFFQNLPPGMPQLNGERCCCGPATRARCHRRADCSRW